MLYVINVYDKCCGVEMVLIGIIFVVYFEVVDGFFVEWFWFVCFVKFRCVDVGSVLQVVIIRVEFF